MIFLTGGTGLLGRAILAELRVHDIPGTALIGRVEDPATWARVTDATAIIHAAAILTARDGWPAFERINVGGTRLAAARARALGIPLIHISSVAVYGDVAGLPDHSVTEDHPFAPLPPHNLYARSKRMAEAAVWEEAGRGLSATVIRPCIIYGPGDRLFLPRLLAAARRGWLPLIGGGDRPVPLVHALSVAQAVRLAVSAGRARGRSFNAANDDVITAREVVAALAAGLGRRIRSPAIPEGAALAGARLFDGMIAPWLPAGRAAGTLRTAVGYWRGGNPFNSDAAKTELGWGPSVSHRAALRALAGAGG